MIGERLAEIRKDHGDNQDDLARKLNVSVFAIRSWEQEKSKKVCNESSCRGSGCTLCCFLGKNWACRL